MSVARKHGIYGVGVGATLLGGITRQSLSTNSDVQSEATSGEIYARFVALYAQRVAPGFTTRSIATALGACGPLGASLAGLSGGFCLYAQKHADGGTRAGTLSHRKFSMVCGILVPRQLTVDHRGDATLSYEAVVTYDGVNDPVVITDLVSLPSGLTDAERFTLGPVTLESVTLSQKTQLTIDFGLDAVGESADSEIWDTLASIRAQHSTIKLEGIDVEWCKAANIPLTGKSATHANTKIYLKKRALGGTFVADGTAQHLKFTAAGLVTPDTLFDGGLTDTGKTNLTMTCYYDGSNAPIVIDTASTIT